MDKQDVARMTTGKGDNCHNARSTSAEDANEQMSRSLLALEIGRVTSGENAVPQCNTNQELRG